MANKKLYKKERFSGCIVGAAAGDALGSPVKTLTRSQIKDLYGKKGILKLSPEKRQKTARISDETQMMLFTAHGILWADAAGLRTGEANCADYVFLALQQWLYSQTGGTSSIDLQWILDDNETGFPCDLLGISAFCKKRNPTKQLVQTLAGIKSENDYGRKRRPINQNKLFDCLPRAIPAGLYFYSEPELAFSVGCDLAAITHSHPTGYLATGCLSAIIAFICKGNTIERSVLNTMKILKEHDGFEECFAALDKALSLLDEETSPLTDGGAWKRQYSGLCACHRRILCLCALRLSQCGTACRKSGWYKRYMRIYSRRTERRTARIFGDSVGICEKAAVCGADKRLCGKDDKSRSKRFYEKIRKRL